jgi:hypothetical protein
MVFSGRNRRCAAFLRRAGGGPRPAAMPPLRPRALSPTVLALQYSPFGRTLTCPPWLSSLSAAAIGGAGEPPPRCFISCTGSALPLAPLLAVGWTPQWGGGGAAAPMLHFLHRERPPSRAFARCRVDSPWQPPIMMRPPELKVDTLGSGAGVRCVVRVRCVVACCVGLQAGCRGGCRGAARAVRGRAKCLGGV